MKSAVVNSLGLVGGVVGGLIVLNLPENIIGPALPSLHALIFIGFVLFLTALAHEMFRHGDYGQYPRTWLGVLFGGLLATSAALLLNFVPDYLVAAGKSFGQPLPVDTINHALLWCLGIGVAYFVMHEIRYSGLLLGILNSIPFAAAMFIPIAMAGLVNKSLVTALIIVPPLLRIPLKSRAPVRPLPKTMTGVQSSSFELPKSVIAVAGIILVGMLEGIGGKLLDLLLSLFKF